MNGGNLDKTLIDATRRGGLRDVRFLLAAGADMHAKLDAFVSSYNPLNIAASRGHLDVMTALLDATPYRRGRPHDDALCSAAEHGQVPAAALLLARGADIHCYNHAPLRIAAGYGKLEMARFLLDNGAAARGKALAVAQRYEHSALVALLLEPINSNGLL
jgi:ankyrin repeat protein